MVSMAKKYLSSVLCLLCWSWGLKGIIWFLTASMGEPDPSSSFGGRMNFLLFQLANDLATAMVILGCGLGVFLLLIIVAGSPLTWFNSVPKSEVDTWAAARPRIPVRVADPRDVTLSSAYWKSTPVTVALKNRNPEQLELPEFKAPVIPPIPAALMGTEGGMGVGSAAHTKKPTLSPEDRVIPYARRGSSRRD